VNATDSVRDDRVLSETRALSLVIFPVLIVAFCVLYPVPTDTQQWFAWEIDPTMTPMVLASAYIGGAYFFFKAWRTSSWHTVKVGFVAVTLFASALGLATIVHWDKFNHGHVAFWLWTLLYFTTPFLVLAVFLRNRAVEPAPAPDELRLPPLVRVAAGFTGVVAFCLGFFLYVAPTKADDVWPWALTPLTSRVMGAVFMLGIAGVGVYLDPRWSTTRLILQVEQVMVALILLAAVRAHDELDSSRPLTWMLGIGLLSVLVASTVLDRFMQRQAA
jgi:hypothetical protein